MSPTPGAPDVAGRLVGWRMWATQIMSPAAQIQQAVLRHTRQELGAGDGLYALTNLGRGQRWPSQLAMRASCHHNVDHSAEGVHAPGADCACGVYAVRTLPDLYDRLIEQASADRPYTQLSTGFCVVGEVAVWGRLVDHERGWRAEHARPLSLLRLWNDDIHDSIAAIAEDYGLTIRDDQPAPPGWNDWHKRQAQQDEAIQAYYDTINRTINRLAQQVRGGMIRPAAHQQFTLQSPKSMHAPPPARVNLGHPQTPSTVLPPPPSFHVAPVPTVGVDDVDELTSWLQRVRDRLRRVVDRLREWSRRIADQLRELAEGCECRDCHPRRGWQKLVRRRKRRWLLCRRHRLETAVYAAVLGWSLAWGGWASVLVLRGAGSGWLWFVAVHVACGTYVAYHLVQQRR